MTIKKRTALNSAVTAGVGGFENAAPNLNAVERTATLIFNTHGDRFKCSLTGTGHGQIGAPRSAVLSLRAADVVGAVEQVRREWQRVLDYEVASANGRMRTFPFLDAWDHRATPEHLTAVAPGLAIAGNKLFRLIFRPVNASAELNDIASRLERASAAGPLVISVVSDDLFLPWWLIYTQPDDEELAADGANWTPEGFWGLQHAIEHRVPVAGDYFRLEAPDGRLRVGANVDLKLDTVKYQVVAPILDFFKKDKRVALADRYTRNELMAALSSTEFGDQIAYFCCHMEVSGDFSMSNGRPNYGVATLSLGGGKVDVGDVQFWLGQRKFGSHPVVFLNSCQGGQIRSLFYHSFAAEFLERAANCVVGSQVDVPYVFAPEYAKRFFVDFMAGNRQLGFVLRDRAVEFFRDFKNPLGLVFSLYQGLDTYLAPIR